MTMSHLRIAVIDIGTNTLKCVVAELHADAIANVFDTSLPVRLGAELAFNGLISAIAMQRCVSALRDLKSKIDSLNCASVQVVGAMTLRTAANTAEFIALVQRELGYSIRVISGEEEAALAWKAATQGISTRDGTCVFDIGGGSTEIAMQSGSQAIYHSLALGVVSLRAQMDEHDPPDAAHLDALRHHIDTFLTQTNIPRQCHSVICCGGTVTSLAAIKLGMPEYDAARVHGFTLSVADIHEMLQRLGAVPLEQRRDIIGLEAGRADVIIPGAVLLTELMRYFDISRVTVSSRGIRHALAMDELRRMRAGLSYT